MKQKLIYLSLSLLFITACSVDSFQKTMAIVDGNGNTTLVSVSTEPEGESCPAGGTRLDFGIDIDADGVLSTEETTSTAFVCNGIDGVDGENGSNGSASLIEVTAVTPGEDCPNGGVLVTNGYDLDGNGTLEETEIAGSTVVCNGTNGSNGLNSLIRTERILESEVCSLGGFLIESGIDTNGNGILDDMEVNGSATNYVCDGEDGKSLSIRVEFLDSENQFCGNGGYLVTIGLDQDGDGELTDTEIVSGTSFPICNGFNGQDGENGYNSIISTEKQTDEEGNIIGTIIYYGLDLNRNNVLEVTERTSSFTVLDGTDGENGTDGYNSLITVEEGFDGETGQRYNQIATGLDLNRDGVLTNDEWNFATLIYDGADGQDGKSVVVRTETTETGTFVIFGYLIEETFTEIDRIFVSNGIDGTDGKTLITKITEVSEESSCTNGGVLVQVGYDLDGDGELSNTEVVDSFEVCNGADGKDGVCEECEAECEGGTVTICHKVTSNNKPAPEVWGDADYVTLELTLSEYVQHVYEYHNGNSTQNDSWGSCEEFVPVRICIKDPSNKCHWNWTTITVENQTEYDFYMGIGTVKYQYSAQSFLTPEGASCNDYDCDSTPNL